MLLTSSERGWPATSCQPGFSPWAEEQEGGGKGAKGWTSCHFFSFFFSLNKCHFLRQRRNRGHFRYPFLWGRLLPQAPSLLPKTLIHFPSQSPNPRGSSHPSQIPLKMIQGAIMSLNLICWTKSGGKTPELGGPGDCPQVGEAGDKKTVAIFTLFRIVFIDSGNKHTILNKMTRKLEEKKTMN